MPAEVEIRPYTLEDVEPVFEAVVESVAELAPWMPWCHTGYAVEETRRWIEHCAVAWARGSEFNFVVVDPEGRVLGTCGLNHFRLERRLANLGYWIRTSAAGRGAATAAVRKLADFAFRETGLERLEIVISVENAASIRVAERAGGVSEGIAKYRLQLGDRWHDAAVYALIRPEGLPAPDPSRD